MSEQTISRLLAVIAGELGGYYPGSSPYGRWYEQETGAKGFASSAFCAMGLSWAARQAGLPLDVIPTFAWTPSGAAHYRQQGRWTAGVRGIRRGDVWFSSCAGLGRISHVGIVESVNADGSFITLEFNTAATINGDQRNGRTVARKRRNSACSLGGFGRPNYPGTSAVLRPEVGGTITPAPVQEDDMTPELKARLDQIVAWQNLNFRSIEAQIEGIAAQMGITRDQLAGYVSGRIDQLAGFTRDQIRNELDASATPEAIAAAIAPLIPAGTNVDAFLDGLADRLKS